MASRRAAPALAGALGLCLLITATEASAWVPIDGSTPVWDVPVTYYVNQSTIPSSISSIAVARIDGGLAEWASPSCTIFSAQNGGDTSLDANYQDGVNVFRWRTGSWPSYLGDVNAVIGVTTPVFDSGQMYDADIQFNNVGFCWNDSGSNGCVDTGSIATHEQGHFLGLGHTPVDGSTMVAYYIGGTAQRTIEGDDVDGVCALYPLGGQAATSGGNDCQSCANSSAQSTCNPQYNTCGASQDCVAFFDCIDACPDSACIDACVAAHPTGADLYIDLVECICGDCATQCSMECGGSSSSSSSGAAVAAASAQSSAVGVGGAATVGSGQVGAGAGDSDDDGELKDEDDDRDPESSSGCGCRAASTSTGAGLTLLFAAGLAGAIARRRRRR